jgi:hypothetical protein
MRTTAAAWADEQVAAERDGPAARIALVERCIAALFGPAPLGGEEHRSRKRAYGVGPYRHLTIRYLAVPALTAPDLPGRLDTEVGTVAAADVAGPAVGVERQ